MDKVLGGISSFLKTNTTYSIRYETGEHATLSILNNHVFRYYMSPTGIFLEYPIPINDDKTDKITSKSIEDYGQEAFDHSVLENTEHYYVVQTNKLRIQFSKLNGTFAVYVTSTEVQVLEEQKPIHYNDTRCRQILKQNPEEYFFGCGMQNGSYTHKGERIHIDYRYNWEDGSPLPKPFYWSTKGYGVLRNTWQIGTYDFGSVNHEIIEMDHEEDYFDAFYFINSLPVDILNDYYELTGSPILMPEYALYEAHVNGFSKVYWHSGSSSYRSMHCDDDRHYDPYFIKTIHGKEGLVGTLNGEGEKTKYEFSARNMIDWYKMHDVPLGWIVPNNESGYGQTDSFAGDLENLRSFVEYANANGVEVALWVEKCLEPNDPDNPNKGERHLAKEIETGVVALKCDDDNSSYYDYSVLEKASRIFVDQSLNKIRPFIIMRGGWAGIQRFAGIWIGEQAGGMWEYIRFHIPTLIGAGLSGLPVAGSLMDGLFGGGDIEVHIREYQWKIFTPLQINIDNWGRTTKIPFAFNSLEDIRFNQASLKLKSMLFPYNYTICHESIHGLPMIRAMFLEYPNERSAYTKDSQYQYMWGPSLLIAPVYENEDPNCTPQYVNSSGSYFATNDFFYNKPTFEQTTSRNGVYLPDPGQVWIDFFTGNRYLGGKIYNNIKAPLWKIPVFVKDGAIIPLVNANSNPKEIKRDCRIFLIYPNGATSFKIYEDDGKSTEYMEDEYAETTINVIGPRSNESGNVSICINKTEGNYRDLVEERYTILQIMASENVDNVKVYLGEIEFDVEEVDSKEEFENGVNVFYFDEEFIINPFLKIIGVEGVLQKCLCIKVDKTNVTENEIRIEIEDFTNSGNVFGSNSIVSNEMEIPEFLTSTESDTTSTSITLHWKEIETSYYELERDGSTIFSNILGNKVTFKYFAPKSQHSFRIRSVGDTGISQWSESIEIETKEESYDDIVKDVTVSSSIPSEYELSESNLTKPDRTFWHTDIEWNRKYYDQPMEKISLSFDLNEVYVIRKIEYLPREYAGNGTILQVQYRHSIDRENWTAMSAIISWVGDDTVKVIEMGNAVKFQYFELDIIDTVEGHGSGRSILFYKN